jgi:hypothetical protein
MVATLVWAHDTDSERQRRDVSGMVAVSGSALDRSYIATWADRLGVGDMWRQLGADQPSA